MKICFFVSCCHSLQRLWAEGTDTHTVHISHFGQWRLLAAGFALKCTILLTPTIRTNMSYLMTTCHLGRYVKTTLLWKPFGVDLQQSSFLNWRCIEILNSLNQWMIVSSVKYCFQVPSMGKYYTDQDTNRKQALFAHLRSKGMDILSHIMWDNLLLVNMLYLILD